MNAKFERAKQNMVMKLDEIKYTILPTNDNLVFNLRVNDKLSQVICLPKVCMFNSPIERLNAVKTAVEDYHKAKMI